MRSALSIRTPLFDTYDKTVSTDFLQMPMETPQLQTQTSDSLGTASVRLGVQAEVGEVVEIRAPFPTESASAMCMSTPVPQAVEKLVEGSKVFSQE